MTELQKWDEIYLGLAASSANIAPIGFTKRNEQVTLISTRIDSEVINAVKSYREAHGLETRNSLNRMLIIARDYLECTSFRTKWGGAGIMFGIFGAVMLADCIKNPPETFFILASAVLTLFGIVLAYNSFRLPIKAAKCKKIWKAEGTVEEKLDRMLEMYKEK